MTHEEQINIALHSFEEAVKSLKSLGVEYLYLTNLGKAINELGELKHITHTNIHLNALSFVSFLVDLYHEDAQVFIALREMIDAAEKKIQDALNP